MNCFLNRSCTFQTVEMCAPARATVVAVVGVWTSQLSPRIRTRFNLENASILWKTCKVAQHLRGSGLCSCVAHGWRFSVKKVVKVCVMFVTIGGLGQRVKVVVASKWNIPVHWSLFEWDVSNGIWKMNVICWVHNVGQLADGSTWTGQWTLCCKCLMSFCFPSHWGMGQPCGWSHNPAWESWDLQMWAKLCRPGSSKSRVAVSMECWWRPLVRTVGGKLLRLRMRPRLAVLFETSFDAICIDGLSAVSGRVLSKEFQFSNDWTMGPEWRLGDLPSELGFEAPSLWACRAFYVWQKGQRCRVVHSRTSLTRPNEDEFWWLCLVHMCLMWWTPRKSPVVPWSVSRQDGLEVDCVLLFWQLTQQTSEFGALASCLMDEWGQLRWEQERLLEDLCKDEESCVHFAHRWCKSLRNLKCRFCLLRRDSSDWLAMRSSWVCFARCETFCLEILGKLKIGAVYRCFGF